jgi:hypothetical protein
MQRYSLVERTAERELISLAEKRAFQERRVQFLAGFFFEGGSASTTCRSGPVVLGVIV